MNLRTKIILVLLPLVVLPLIIMGLIAFDRLSKYSHEMVFTQASTLLNQVEDNVQAHLDTATANIELFAGSELLRRYLLIEDEASRYDLMQSPLLYLFSSYVEAYPSYYEIRVVLPDGYEDTRFTAKTIPNIHEEEGNSQWFKEARQEKNNIYITFQKNPDNQELALLIAKKILLTNDAVDVVSIKPSLRGYLVITIRPDFVTNQTKKNTIGQNGFLFFVGAGGVILAHPEEKLFYQTLSAGKFDTLREYVQKRDALKTEYLGQTVSIQGRQLAPNLWVFAVLPEQDLVAAGRGLKMVVAIITLSTILFSSCLLYFVMNRLFLKPIGKLSKASHAVGQGDLNVRLTMKAKDEIGVLFTAFNKMVQEIRISKEKIEAHQTELEQKVTERTKHLELANVKLIAAQKETEYANQAKRDFLANMSHEIRTPLNGIIGMAELAMDMDLEDNQKDFFATINAEADSLLNIINDILDFSKIEAGKLKLEEIPFDLITTIENVANSFAYRAKQKGLELISFLSIDAPSQLIGDPGRLRQIVINLAGNALKFTQEGEIYIKGEIDEDLEDRVKIRVSVKDTGIGIPKDKQAAIFESFSQADGSTTRRYGGTGLGTAISKQLTEMMGGEIGVESEEGKGSTFWFTAVFNKQKEQGAFQAAGKPDLKNIRVLVVDDNRTNRFVQTEYLRCWDCRPVEASNGQDALIILRKSVSSEEPFDLILTDFQMPGMSGFDLAREIRAIDDLKETPIIVLTSAGMKGDGRSCRDLGINGYLTKPIKRDDLRRAIESVLGLAKDKDLKGKKLVTRHTIAEDDRKDARILLVEDYPTNQVVALGHLHSAGYQVDLAENGQLAVEAFKHKQYDLILMDIQMPVMDGYEASNAIRNLENELNKIGNKKDPGKLERIPIIAMTAHAIKGYEEKCLEAGMDAYITKPLRRKGLLDIVDKWTERIDDCRLLIVDCKDENAKSQSVKTVSHPRKIGISAPLRQSSPKNRDLRSAPSIIPEKSGSPLRSVNHQSPTANHQSSITNHQSSITNHQSPIPNHQSQPPPMNFEMVLDDFEGDRELLVEAMDLFLESVKNQLGALRRAISDNDADLVKREAHSIKGGAANLTADDLSRVASELENIGKSGTLAANTVILERLEKEFYRLDAFAKGL